MLTHDYVKMAVFIGTFGCAMSAMMYKRYAEVKRWPTGFVFHKHDALIVLGSVFLTISLLVWSLISIAWWCPFFVLLMGSIVAFLILSNLRQWTQPLSVLGSVLGTATLILWPVLVG